MNAQTATRLAAQIGRDDPQVRITGTRAYGQGSFALDCLDTRTGYPFVVNSREDWERRRADAALESEPTHTD